MKDIVFGEKYPVVIGETIKNPSSCSQQYTTLQYVFKPSSVENKPGVINIADNGEVELKYNISESNSEVQNEIGNNSHTVKLKGMVHEPDESYVDLVLLKETDKDTGKVVFRLERVSTVVTGLNHVRDAEFNYNDSQLAKKRVYNKRVLKLTQDSIVHAVTKKKKKELMNASAVVPTSTLLPAPVVIETTVNNSTVDGIIINNNNANNITTN